MQRQRLFVLATAVGLVAPAGPVLAQAASPVPGPLPADSSAPAHAAASGLEELDQRIRVLQRKLELAQEAADAARLTAPIVSVGAGGVQFRAPDGASQVRFRGYLHEDGRFLAQPGQPAGGGFLLRRVRPIIEGTVFRYYAFRLMTDFGEGKASLQDAYLDVAYLPQLQLRFGKFKPPVGLERLQSATSLLFVERGLPTNLVPNRDVGVQLWGDLRGGALSYAAGLFDGAADGGSLDADADRGKDVAGRLFLHPFRNTGLGLLGGLGVGVAASHGTRQGTLAATGLAGVKTAAQLPFFSYRSDGKATGTTLADGAHRRLAPQGYYYHGPLGVLGEYVLSSQRMRRDAEVAELTHRAWQVAGSLVLTGEEPSFAGVRPRRSFDPRAGTPGALELVARVGGLTLDRATFPAFADPLGAARAARAWGVGANWHLNPNVKLSVNYEDTRFEGGATTGSRPRERGILSRIQLAF